jgi:hypothetical protein
VAAGEHLGERGHVGGGGVEVRAGRQYLLELELVVGSRSSGRRSIQEVIWRTLGIAGVGGGAAPSARYGAR